MSFCLMQCKLLSTGAEAETEQVKNIEIRKLKGIERFSLEVLVSQILLPSLDCKR